MTDSSIGIHQGSKIHTAVEENNSCMQDTKTKLLIEQMDRKFEKISRISDLVIPTEGWVHSVRNALKMNLRQLGARLGITAQSVKEIELREKHGSVTLNTLKEVGNALDMRLVYGFIPREKSLEQMIEKRALEVARQIVLRTSATMTLEDQKNTKERLRIAIEDRAKEIKSEMPKYLWD